MRHTKRVSILIALVALSFPTLAAQDSSSVRLPKLDEVPAPTASSLGSIESQSGQPSDGLVFAAFFNAAAKKHFPVDDEELLLLFAHESSRGSYLCSEEYRAHSLQKPRSALPALGAYVHPYAFISSRVGVGFGGNKLTPISVDWTFDELLSQMIISDFDGGKKGSFTEAESVALKKGAFDRMSPAAVALVSSDSIGTIVSIEKTKVKAERPCQFMPDQIVLWMKRKSRNA